MDPQQTPNPTPPTPPQHSVFPLLLTIVLLAFVGGTAVLGYQNWVLLKKLDALQIAAPVQKNIPSPTPMFDATTSWLPHSTNDANLRISFKLPPPWKTTYGNIVEQSMAGQRGVQFCLTLTHERLMNKIVPRIHAGNGPCDNEWFSIGGLSKDYESGRGAGFTDTNGFSIENGTYYYLQNLNRKVNINQYVIEEYTSPKNINFILVQGENSVGTEYAGPIIGTPGDGYIGALVNIPNNKISGLAFKMNTQMGDVTLLKQILSTFTINQ